MCVSRVTSPAKSAAETEKMWSMSEKNDLDDAAAPESSEVFEFGESTILQLRNQPFRVGDQYGTMMSVPLPEAEAADASPFAPETESAPAAEPPANASAGGDDAIARLERKLDLALRQIEQLQQRLDSIDSALMRALHR